MEENTTQNAFSSQTEEQLAALLHELKSPLSVTLSSLQLLEYKLKANDEAVYEKEYSRFFDIASRNVYRSLRMANNLIDTMRVSQNAIRVVAEPTDLVELIAELCESAQLYAQMHKIDLTFCCECDTVTAMCEAQMISRVVMNLISNALKAVQPEEGYIRIDLSRENDFAKITVTDNGCGMDEETTRHIFEKYWRTPQAGGDKNGLGLGLYIAKALLSLHGGSVSVQSAAGKGSSFTVLLPLHPVFSNQGDTALASVPAAYAHDWISVQAQVELSEFL